MVDTRRAPSPATSRCRFRSPPGNRVRSRAQTPARRRAKARRITRPMTSRCWCGPSKRVRCQTARSRGAPVHAVLGRAATTTTAVTEAWARPRPDEPAVNRDAVEELDERAVLDLEALHDIERIDLGAPGGDIGEVPAPRWRGAPHPALAVDEPRRSKTRAMVLTLGKPAVPSRSAWTATAPYSPSELSSLSRRRVSTRKSSMSGGVLLGGVFWSHLGGRSSRHGRPCFACACDPIGQWRRALRNASRQLAWASCGTRRRPSAAEGLGHPF